MKTDKLDFSTVDPQNQQVDDRSNATEEYRLSPLESAAIQSIIEECIDVLAIYRYAFAKPSTRVTVCTDLAPTEISHYVEKLLAKTKMELRKCGEFTTLTNEIESISAKREREESILLKCEEAEKSIAKLQRNIANEASSGEQDKKIHEDELLHTQNEIKRLLSKANGEIKYVGAWEKARCEQNSLRCDVTLERLSEDLRKCFIEEKHEERVMTNLETFVEQNIELNKKRIADLQHSYSQKMNGYKEKICKLQDEIKSNRLSVGVLTEEHCSKQEFIDAYLADKEKIRRQREREEHTQISAIRIQAWWRGVMVRRKLGPYRPEERKKKRAIKSRK